MSDHIVMHLAPRITIQEFCKKYGVLAEVRERSHVAVGSPTRYYASLSNTSIKNGGCLVSPFCNGCSPEEALEGLPDLYTDKELVIDSFSPERQDVGPFVFIRIDNLYSI